MQYAFFGTPDFSARILEKLVTAGHPPAVVVTNPDRPAGRKKVLTAPPVKAWTMEHGTDLKKSEAGNIKVIQPERLTADLPELQGLDFFLVAAYGKILSPAILSLPRLGIIGWHPSLLPKYRGPSPMQTPILRGEAETGVTLYLMAKGVDNGPILAQRSFPLTEQTHRELQMQSADLGAEMLLKLLPLLRGGCPAGQPQDEHLATFTKKFSASDAFVPPMELQAAWRGESGSIATRISRMIRVLNPEPGVWTYGAGLPAALGIPEHARVKLLAARLTGGRLILTELQTAGRSRRTII